MGATLTPFRALERPDAALRAGLLRDGRPSDLLAYADVHPWDTEILERAVALMDDGDPLLPVVTARLVVAVAQLAGRGADLVKDERVRATYLGQ